MTTRERLIEVIGNKTVQNCEGTWTLGDLIFKQSLEAIADALLERFCVGEEHQYHYNPNSKNGDKSNWCMHCGRAREEGK